MIYKFYRHIINIWDLDRDGYKMTATEDDLEGFRKVKTIYKTVLINNQHIKRGSNGSTDSRHALRISRVSALIPGFTHVLKL